MKNLAFCTILCGCLLCPLIAPAKTPTYGISTISEVYREGNEETHPKKLQIAIAITEELGKDGAPLTFFSYYENDDNELFKGKVTLKVTIFRGKKRLWKGSRTTKVEFGDAWHFFCDAYDKGLLPGDIVVFDFKIKGVPGWKNNIGANIFAQLGPSEMWSVDQTFWNPNSLDCP